MFAAWDDDGNGTVSRAEFIRVMNGLRLCISKEEASALFDEFDTDRSGSIDYQELYDKLRVAHEHHALMDDVDDPHDEL